MLITFNNIESVSQCPNSGVGVWGATAPVGIQTNMPAKPLHILGTLNCPDPAIRLEYQPYMGHIVLLTPANLNQYSILGTPGDMTLQADVNAGDLLLTTRNNTSSIRFATTPVAQGPDIERMTITPDGKVGIGITSPTSLLNIKGVQHGVYTSSLNIINSLDEPLLFVRDDGFIGMGTQITDWSTRLLIQGFTNSTDYSLRIINSDNDDLFAVKDDGNVVIGSLDYYYQSRLFIKGSGNDESTKSLVIWNSDNDEIFSVRDDGLVSFDKLKLGPREVNENSPYFDKYILSVDGTIVTTEVVVSNKDEDWSDFVFNDNYSLMPLDELEKSIADNRHLPGIPSANDVSEKGINIGQMQSKLLQKIEELTLYIIQLKKEIIELNNQKESAR